MKTVNYLFVFNRKNKLNKKGEAPIHLSITIDRQRKYIPTNIKVKPNQWDAKKRCIYNHFEQVRLNLLLDKLENKYKKIELNLIYKNEPVTLDKFTEEESNKITFLEFYQKQLDNSIDLSPGTFRQRKVVLQVLKNFKKIVEFEDLTYQNILDFDNYLRTKEGISKQSTIHGYHKRLKIMVNRAVNMDYIPLEKNPYLKFKPRTGRSDERKFLTQEELQKIEEKKINIERLAKVRDFFIFQCYTGLSYSDLEKLTPDNIYTDEDGDQWIKVYRTKTEEKSSILLLPKALEILNKYKTESKLLPISTNQRYNSYLDEIAGLCDIEKKITTHVARHTFATTVTLANGVSLEVVSKALGHANLKTTQIYSKMVDKRIKNELNKLKNPGEPPPGQNKS